MSESQLDASDLVTYELEGDVALIGINRPAKRNAIHDLMFAKIGELAERASHEARVGIIYGVGDNFSAGLDLAATAELFATGRIEPQHVRRHTPHVAFDWVARGQIPFVAALQGATIGAGLELAASAHVRVADSSSYFALPEGQRGIFVGAGGAVRIQRLLGNARMSDMMLTGRILDAEEGLAANLVQYVVEPGQALAKAHELATLIAKNTAETNWAIINGLTRLNDMSHDDALWVETLLARSAVSSESTARLMAFVDKRAERLNQPVNSKS
jgi:enoyl-CoA hydratase/carnithine racemase